MKNHEGTPVTVGDVRKPARRYGYRGLKIFTSLTLCFQDFQRKQMTEDAYRLGQTSLIELLDSSRTRTEIKLNHLELIQNEVEAEIDVMNASGLLDLYISEQS